MEVPESTFLNYSGITVRGAALSVIWIYFLFLQGEYYM